jgi:hypothetical protein
VFRLGPGQPAHTTSTEGVRAVPPTGASARVAQAGASAREAIAAADRWRQAARLSVIAAAAQVCLWSAVLILMLVAR